MERVPHDSIVRVSILLCWMIMRKLRSLRVTFSETINIMCRSAVVSCQDCHCTCSYTFDERRNTDSNGAPRLQGKIENSFSRLHFVRVSTAFSSFDTSSSLVLIYCPSGTHCSTFFSLACYDTPSAHTGLAMEGTRMKHGVTQSNGGSETDDFPSPEQPLRDS